MHIFLKLQIMEKNDEHKKIADYFRSNIFEAFSAYNAWKMIAFSKSNGVVSNQMAERYVEIQKYHANFFIIAERAFLINFVIFILHSFDKRNDSYSLYKIDQTATDRFINNNKKVLDELKNLRNKLFAHRDNDASSNQYKIPSINDLDNFFENLITFYNQLTSAIDDSTTQFTNATEIKRDIELLLQNIYRGETVRKLEINIEWMWEKDDKKASNII